MYLDGFVEEVDGTIHNTPHYRHWIAKHIQAKDESVQLKEELVSIVLQEKIDQSTASLRLVLKMEDTESVKLMKCVCICFVIRFHSRPLYIMH